MFKTRLISGILLVIAALLTIISGGYVLFFTLVCISLIGMQELYKAMGVHGGFVVNNNLWNWFARGIGGTAIDYLSKVEGMDFVNAVL